MDEMLIPETVLRGKLLAFFHGKFTNMDPEAYASQTTFQLETDLQK